MDLYKKIQLLAPFGMKNPEPLFVSKKVIIEEARAIGANGKHLKLKLRSYSSNQVRSSQTLSSNNIIFDAVAFGMGEKISDLKTGSLIDIVYSVDLNVWRGKESLQLKIKDLKIAK